MTTPEPPPYNPNYPPITDSYADWQPNFQNNFTQLANAFAANHVPLTATSNAGNHTVIQLLQKSTLQQTNAAEFAVYTKDAVGQTHQLFMRYQLNGTEFQYTNYQIYPLPSMPGTYFTFLPGRIICYFGLAVKTGTGKQQVLIPLFPKIAKNILSVNFTPNSNPGTFQGYICGLQGEGGFFTIIQTFSNTSFYYMVLANV